MKSCWAIYIRKSSLDSDQRAYRLEHQREFLPQYAKSQGWDYKIYDEGITSASDIKKLPKLNEILSHLSHFEGILTIDPTRISRDASAQDYIWFLAQCSKAGVKLATPQSHINLADSNQWLLAGFSALSSAKEMRDLSKRTHEAKVKMIDEGRWTGGRIPIGYKWNFAKKKMEIDPPRAKLVRHICELLAQYSIADTIRKLPGVKNRSGGFLRRGWVSRVFSDKKLYYYAGWVKNSRDEWIAGQHSPIISQELLERVIQVKHDRQGVGHKFYTAKYLLTGLNLFKCGYCGGSVNVTGPKPYSYYVCMNKHRIIYERGCLQSKEFKRDYIEEKIISTLIEKLTNRKSLEAEYRAMQRFQTRSPKDKLLQDTFSEIEQKQVEKIRLIKLAKQVSGDKDIASELLKLNEEIRQLQFKSKNLNRPATLPFTLDDLIQLSQKVKSFHSFSWQDKREFLKLAIKRISLFKDCLVINYNFLTKPQKIRI